MRKNISGTGSKIELAKRIAYVIMPLFYSDFFISLKNAVFLLADLIDFNEVLGDDTRSYDDYDFQYEYKYDGFKYEDDYNDYYNDKVNDERLR